MSKPIVQKERERNFEYVNSEFVKKQYDSVLKYAKEKVFKDEKKYKIFEERLEARYKPSIEADRGFLSEYLYDMQEALEEQARLNEINDKVKKERAEYEANRKDTSDHVPGTIKIEEWGPYMATLMGLETTYKDESGRTMRGGRRWNTLFGHHDLRRHDLYHKKDVVREIIESREPIKHSQLYHRPGGVMLRKGAKMFIPIPKKAISYDEALARASEITKDDVEQNLRDIDYLLYQGSKPPHRKPGLYGELKHRSEPVREKLEDASSLFLDLLNFGVQKVGRGVFTKSDPRKSDDFRQYLQKRNDLLSKLLWKLNVSPSAHATVMKRLQDEMNKLKEDPDYLLDPTSFSTIMESITNEIKAANLGYETQTKEINDTINALNKAMYEDVKDKTKNDDLKWKYKLLQGFLMVSPFMGIAYMTPFLNAFSGVFLNSEGLGAGIASLATGQYTGIFGDVANAIGIDDLIEFILTDVPIISHLVDILDYLTQNTIFHNLATSAFIPLAGGPLAYLAAPIGGGIYGAARELEDYEKYSKKFKGHDKKLVEAVTKFHKELKNHEEKRKADFEKAIGDLLDGKVQDGISNNKVTFKDTKITKPEHRALLKNGMTSLMTPNLTQEEIAHKRLEVAKLVKKLELDGKKQKTVLDIAHKIFDDYHEGPNTNQFVTNIESILEQAYFNRFRAEFWQTIYDMDKPQAAIMRQLIGNDVINKLTVAGVIDKEFNVKKMLEFLVDENNKDVALKIEKISLLFCGAKSETVEGRIKEVENLLKEENNLKAQSVVIIQKELRRQEYIVQRAEKLGFEDKIDELLKAPTQDLTVDEIKERKALADQLKAKFLEHSIKKLDVNVKKRKGLADAESLPNTRVSKSYTVRQLTALEREIEAPNGIGGIRNNDIPLGL